jgi:serine/threonine protein kinase
MSTETEVWFGRYRLLEQLGAGGMARVFRAVSDGPKGFARELVIKRIRSEHCTDVRFVNMLASEARLCGLLRHPGIVQVHEFGEVDGEYYLAMELVEGPDLRDVIRACGRSRRVLPVGLTCHIIGELATALAYAHALTDESGRPLDIVHRDLSLANIMISSLGMVKLLDFGIAKAASHMRDEETRDGSIKGKIRYMSPEQAEGKPLDRRSDIFSLGVVFYECLTLRHLFSGASDFERLRMVREAQVVPPSKIVAGIDPAVEAVVLKMLARDADARYASGDEIALALAPMAHRMQADARALKRFIGDLTPFFEKKKGLTPASPSDGRRETESSPVQIEPRLDSEPELPRTKPVRIHTLTGSNGELRATPPAPRRWGTLAGAGALIGGMVAFGGWVGREPSTPGPSISMTAATLALGASIAATGTPTARPAAPTVASAAGVAAPTGVAAPNPAASTTAPAATAAPKTTAPAVQAAPATSPVENGEPPTVVIALPALAASSPPRAVAGVRLRILGPADAELWLDGRRVGNLPVDLKVPPVAGERTVVVERAGYAAWSRKVAGNAPVSLTARPSRKRAAAHSAHPTPSVSVPPPTRAKPSGRVAPGADPIYDPFPR